MKKPVLDGCGERYIYHSNKQLAGEAIREFTEIEFFVNLGHGSVRFRYDEGYVKLWCHVCKHESSMRYSGDARDGWWTCMGTLGYVPCPGPTIPLGRLNAMRGRQ